MQSSRSNVYSKVAAVSYALLGLLDLVAGLSLISRAAQGRLVDFFAAVTPLVAVDPSLDGNRAVAAIASFHAYNFIWIGLSLLIVAIRFTWHNNRLGAWLCGGLGAVVGVGFVALLFLPGIMPAADGSPVLILWGAGWLFSWLGLRHARRAGTLQMVAAGTQPPLRAGGA
jgi:hypothetical protein